MAEKLVRTDSELQFQVETSELYSVGSSNFGELVVMSPPVPEVIRSFVDLLYQGIRDSEADQASIEFGIEINESGGVFVSRGTADAHAVVRIQYQRPAG
jgi:hypothetical protein